MLCSYSKINMGDSCLKFKKGDSKLFRPNSTHEEKSAIQESISVTLEEECGCTCTTLATTLRGGETKQTGTLNYDRL